MRLFFIFPEFTPDKNIIISNICHILCGKHFQALFFFWLNSTFIKYTNKKWNGRTWWLTWCNAITCIHMFDADEREWQNKQSNKWKMYNVHASHVWIDIYWICIRMWIGLNFFMPWATSKYNTINLVLD